MEIYRRFTKQFLIGLKLQIILQQFVSHILIFHFLRLQSPLSLACLQSEERIFAFVVIIQLE